MRQLARQPFDLELRRHRRIESDDKARLAGDGVPFLALVRHEDLVQPQFDALDDDEAVAALVPPLGERRADPR